MPARSKPRITQTQWSIKAEEMLADGQWHDGMTVIREVEKLITPGVAIRKVAGRRASRHRREGTEDPGRKRPMRDSTLIAMGKRTLMQQMVHARVKVTTWETDPSPIPKGGWRVGGWRLRDRRAGRTTVRQIAKDRYHVAPDTLRRLVLAEPAMPYEVVGRVVFIHESDLPQLDERVRAYKEESRGRYSAGRQMALRRQQAQKPTRYAVTALARQFGVGSAGAIKIVKVHPDFPWVRSGRNTYVPVELIAEFGKLCQQWKADRPARISAGARGAKARKRAERERDEATPQFADQGLTELYARYRHGEDELQDQVYDEMKRAFHAAPEM